ncbi:MAG: S41 family peptidase [Holosporales bacterium]|jgi:carboxyl-terminal processing protease|nr:S41 family peptidase [Holosporales bacterium]
MKYFWEVVTAFGLAVAVLATSCKKKENTSSSDIVADLLDASDVLKEIINEIKSGYASDVSREKLEIGAINGMLQVLDEHSTYITQDECDAFHKSTRGSFLGIGVEIKQGTEGIEVVSVIDDSPAAISGLKAADVITHINKEDVLKMSMKRIVSKLSSDSAMEVTVHAIRNKTEEMEFRLKKSVIQLRSVRLDFAGDIAIIKINYFNDGTFSDVSNAIAKLLKKDAKGVIIDLRNNPGGILEQAISVCDLFLANKKIVEFKSKNADETKTVFATDNDVLNGLPMAVLIGSNTASGGELVAAALGDNKRAILIGQKTYGKGSLQTVIPIPGKGAIKLTTAYFTSPNGNIIDKTGISPDIDIAKLTQEEEQKPETAPYAEQPIIQRAVDILHGVSALQESDPEPESPDGNRPVP